MEWDARYHVQNLNMCMCVCLCIVLCSLGWGSKAPNWQIDAETIVAGAKRQQRNRDNSILTHTWLHILRIHTHTHTSTKNNAFIYSCLYAFAVRPTLTTGDYNNFCISAFFASSYQLQQQNKTCQSEFILIVFFPLYFAALPCLKCSQLIYFSLFKSIVILSIYSARVAYKFSFISYWF